MPVASPKTNVISQYVNASGIPVEGVPVFALLVGDVDTTDGVIERQVEVRTDANGLWTLPLYPNSLFVAPSYYIISIGKRERYSVSVPLSSSPVQFTSLVSPSSPSDPTEQFYGQVTFLGNLYVQGNLNITGELKYSADLSQSIDTLPGPAVFLHDATITGNVEVIGDIVTTGTVVAGSLTYVGEG